MVVIILHVFIKGNISFLDGIYEVIMEYLSELEFGELIVEVSQYRSKILQDIDENFRQIKKDMKHTRPVKELMKNISKFSGISHVIVVIKDGEFDAGVIPIYNRLLSLDVLKTFKQYGIKGDNIRALTTAEESSKYIDKIYFILGTSLIDIFSPRELTSILLHELGHVFVYTSNIPRILLAILQKCTMLAGNIFKIPFLLLTSWVTLPMHTVLSLIIITISRSLTFFEHMSEYRADQYAAKYGYGDEIVKVLYKLHNMEVAQKNDMSWLAKVWNFINDIFLPTSHPPSSRRIKKISKYLIDEYKELYPKLSKELTIILSHYS